MSWTQPFFTNSGQARAVVPKALRARTTRCAAVLAGFVALTLALFWPWIEHLNTILIGPPEDNLQDFWNTWYAVAGHGTNFFHTRLLHFPQGASLTYQSFAYPQVFTIVLLAKVLGRDLATLLVLQNVTILASVPIAATGAFYLVRHITKNAAAGTLGGFIFAFNPWHLQMVMHHAHVSGIEFIPFFVLFYLLALERRSIGWLLSAIVLYAASALMCWYFLFYIAYFIVFHFIWLIFRHHKLPDRWNIIVALATLGGCAVLLSPLAVPMVLDGLKETVYAGGTNDFAADLFAYVVPPPTHLLAGWTRGFYAHVSGNFWEGTVYIGVPILALLAWWYAKRRGTGETSYVLAGMLTFWVFASGDSLHVNGYDLQFLHMPSNALSKLAFFANVRTPSRAVVFIYLFAALGVGAAVTTLLQEPTRLRKAAAGAIALLIFADFYPARLASTPVACAPQFAILRNDPAADFGVLSLPSGYRAQNVAMFEQVCHGRPLAGGNTTRDYKDPLLGRLRDKTHQGSELKQTRVKYILVHQTDDVLYPWYSGDGSRAALLAAYPHVYDGADMTILKVY